MLSPGLSLLGVKSGSDWIEYKVCCVTDFREHYLQKKAKEKNKYKLGYLEFLKIVKILRNIISDLC